MIDQAKVDAAMAEINAVVQTGSTIAATVDPALLPYVLIGKAVGAVAPSLVDDAVSLINNGSPTAADNTALATKIASLQNPAAL